MNRRGVAFVGPDSRVPDQYADRECYLSNYRRDNSGIMIALSARARGIQ